MKKITTAALMMMALAGAGTAMASDTPQVNPDGWVFKNGEWSPPVHSYDTKDGKLVHTDTLPHHNGAAPKQQAASSNDGWVFENGEWGRIPHAYEFRQGQLVHVDKLYHSPPKAREPITAEERARQNELYGR